MTNKLNPDRLINIEAELTGLIETLNKLDSDFEDAIIGEAFYYRKRQALVKKHALSISVIESYLIENGETKLAQVVKEASGNKPNKIQLIQDLQEAALNDKSKSWGEKVLDQIKEHSGDIAEIAIKIAIAASKTFI